MNPIANYINGAYRPPENKEYIENHSPATGETYVLTPDSDEKNIHIAVKAAKMAFLEWRQRSVQDRAACLYKVADLIRLRSDPFAEAESLDTGKPLHLARSVDILRAAANFHFFAAGIEHFASESHTMENTAINYTLRKPLGVVGCISHWNLPLYLFSWKIVPALAAGNCVVGKPSERMPMTAFLLTELCREAQYEKDFLA